jgi:hypothetical protein
VLKLLLALALFKGSLNVENFTKDFFVIHFCYSFSGTSGSVLAVSGVFTAVANESVKTIVVLSGENGGNATESFESLLQIGLLPLIWNIFNENVIEDLSKVSFAPWSKLDTDGLTAALTFCKGS